MAGRDIGTVVLPDADLKLYLDASVEERARRRVEERGLDPAGPEAGAILEALRARDRVDRGRAVAPLRVPDDAIVLRTDGNRFEDTVGQVVAAIEAAEAARAAQPPQTGARARPR
jgi:cytidylate kinase